MARERNAFADQCALLADREVRTIFDIGAHNGETTACYRAVFPKANIHSFEPFPQEFDKLTKRLEKDARVFPVRSAVSNDIGRTCFYVNHNSATNSLLPSARQGEYWTDSPQDLKQVSHLEVFVTTIHAYCQQNEIEAIDIVKIDAQGSERLVLEGATDELRRGSIAVIQTEMQIVPVYEGQAFFYDLAGFLSQYGYSLFGIYNMAYAANGQAKWCDAIFVSPNVRARHMELTQGGRQSAEETVEARHDKGIPTPVTSSHQNGLDGPQHDSNSLPPDLLKCREDLARLGKEKHQLETQWQAVQNSAGWRLLNRWRMIREQLAPQNSLLRRLYDSLVGKLSKPKAG